MRLVFAVLVLLCSTSLPARSMESANELLSSCESFLRAYRPTGGSGFRLEAATASMYGCWGFITALQQLSAVWADEGQTTTVTGACPPPETTTVQLLRVVVAYMQRHPENLHLQAASVSIYALKQAFPCK